jgi:hypothetical protein
MNATHLEKNSMPQEGEEMTRYDPEEQDFVLTNALSEMTVRS